MQLVNLMGDYRLEMQNKIENMKQIKIQIRLADQKQNQDEY